MVKNNLIKKLQELAQTDIDTVQTYNRVLDEISDDIVRSRLTEFRDSHINHIAEISEEIRKLSGEPPKLTRDFKGYVIEAFAAIGTAVGMKSALTALKTAENIAFRNYKKFMPEDWPLDLQKLVRRHFSDINIHIEYIDNNLKVL